MPALEQGTTIRGPVTTNTRDEMNKRASKRRTLYRELPLDKSPIAKIAMQQASRRPINRVVHDWAQQRFNPRQGDVSRFYNDAQLSSAYNAGSADAGEALYMKLPNRDVAKQLKRFQQLLIHHIDSDHVVKEVMVDVQEVVVATNDTSYAVVELLEDDDDVLNQSSGLTWRISSNAQSELSGLPDETYEEPIWTQNVTQIFMESLAVSGSEVAEETAEELDDTMLTRKRFQTHDALMMDVERSVLFGRFKRGTGPNGRRRNMMRGLKTAMKEHSTDLIMNFPRLNAYAGGSWLEKGWDFIKDVMLDSSRYSGNEKYVWCGDLALRAINDMIEEETNIQIGPTHTDGFGIRVRTIYGLNTTLHLHNHVLFSTDPAYRRSAFVFEPALISLLPLRGRDIQYLTSDQARRRTENGWTWLDGFKEGWYGELTLEYDNLAAMRWLDGLGLDNTLTASP